MTDRGGRRGEPIDRAFARRAWRGAGITFAVLSLLLALAWYPFLDFGLSLAREGRAGLGYPFILATGALYLLLWLRARWVKEWFVEDARAGRIRMVPIRAPTLQDERGREAFPKAATTGMMGYERPRADGHLWWMLLLAFLAGWMMYAGPWNSRLLRDRVGCSPTVSPSGLLHRRVRRHRHRGRPRAGS